MFKKDYPGIITTAVFSIFVFIAMMKIFDSFDILGFFACIFWGVVCAIITLVILLKVQSKQEEQAQMEAAREKARQERAAKERAEKAKKEAELKEIEARKRAEREAAERQAQYEAEYEKRQAEEQERIARMSASSQKYLDSMPKRKITLGEKDCTIRKNLIDMPQLKISTVRKDSSPDSLKNYVVIDVETTGLDADHDEIIEVAAIRYSAGEVKEAFQTYVKPLNEIPMKITQINGITNETVENAPHFSQIVAELEDFIGTSNLVGHNIEFDIKFLYAAGYDMFRFKNRKYYDTLKLARRVIKPDEVTNYKLGTLIHEYSGCFESANAHSALSDCLDTMRLYNMLLNDLGIY